jgi:hypothetical protein
METLKAFNLLRIETTYRGLFFFPDDTEVPIHQEADVRNLVKGRGEDYLKIKLAQKPDTADNAFAVHFGKGFVEDDDSGGVGFFIPAYPVELGKGRQNGDVKGRLCFTA